MISIIALNVKTIMAEKGFKQRSVAKKAGFKECEFSNMMNGRKIIKGDDVLPIANALGVTPNDILRIDTNQTTN